jgi:hypothetical protein
MRYLRSIKKLYDSFVSLQNRVLLSLRTPIELVDQTINQILKYDAPKRARPTRIGRLRLLNQQQVYDIISYISFSYKHRCLNYLQLKTELQLDCLIDTLERRLKE